MTKQKSFWKKYEYVIVAIITLILIYIFVLLSQKVNYILGNDFIIYLSPQQKSFYTHYSEVSKAEFDVSIDNFAYCSASCSYSFNDRSRNMVIDSGIFELQKDIHYKKNYNISIKRLGSGQDIYSFDVTCHSVRSALCLTQSPEKFSSALVAVNYDLTESEKELKFMLRQNVTKLLNFLADVDVEHQEINQKYFQTALKANLLNLSKEKIDIDEKYDKIRISIENLRSLWAVENYITLNQLFNESFAASLYEVKNSIAALDMDIETVKRLHNSLLSSINDQFNKLKELYSFSKVLQEYESQNRIMNTYKKLGDTAGTLKNNTFNNYNNLTKNIDDIIVDLNSISQKSSISSLNFFLNASYYLTRTEDYICSLQKNCKENISLITAFNESEIFLKKFPNASQFQQVCNSLQSLNATYSQIVNQTLKIIAERNITFTVEPEFINLANNFSDDEIRKINNSYYESFAKIKSENETNVDVINIAELYLPYNRTDIVTAYIENFINMSLYLLSQLKPSVEIIQLLNKCAIFNDAEYAISDFTLEPVTIQINYTAISRINTNLSDNPPLCCVFNDCKQCCRDTSCENDPRTFPIVFVHGHSFQGDNSPEFSLEAFNKLQLILQEDGYLNAGVMLYSEEAVKRGEWGLSGKPVTIKVSYYYDVYTKENSYTILPTMSESIDTYALRLNDIINVVKEKTGRPKVNIIAFSMGGLVARKYMQIFNDDSVYKLIMVATPNKGISGTAARLCPVLGENKECINMHQDSLFLNRLNSPNKQPSKVKLYNIFGKGCQQDDKDGDGVVLIDQASLKGIANATEHIVNGTCNGQLEYFHTDLIDPDKFPTVYEIIKEILKEQS